MTKFTITPEMQKKIRDAVDAAAKVPQSFLFVGSGIKPPTGCKFHVCKDNVLVMATDDFNEALTAYLEAGVGGSLMSFGGMTDDQIATVEALAMAKLGIKIRS